MSKKPLKKDEIKRRTVKRKRKEGVKLCEDYEDKTPSKMAPATMVYKLIELLKPHFE